VAVSCSGCGSALTVDPLAPKWACGHCGRVNVNEAVVAAALRQSGGFGRASALVELGRIEYESGNYERALLRFEAALVESPNEGELWAFAAIAAARAATADTLAPTIDKVSRCLERALSAGSVPEFVHAVRIEAEEAMIVTAESHLARSIAAVKRQDPRTKPDLTIAKKAMRCCFEAMELVKADAEVRFGLAAQMHEAITARRVIVASPAESLERLEQLMERLAAERPALKSRLESIRLSQRITYGMKWGIALAAIAAVILALILSNQ